jgi:hypothetical protein
MMPAMANAQLGRGRMGVQQNQQALAARMPDLRNQAEAQNKLRQEGPAIRGTTLPGF